MTGINHSGGGPIRYTVQSIPSVLVIAGTAYPLAVKSKFVSCQWADGVGGIGIRNNRMETPVGLLK